jgi:broad specificity phosphatase PhoE
MAEAQMPFLHRILFVRHGETAWNAENRLQGQRDIPLNPRGREQASAVGRILRARIPDELRRLDREGAFVASPLSRARETMERMRMAMGLEPAAYRLDPTLIELTFGEWEGQTWSEVAARDPKGVRARLADKWNYAPPGGESYARLAVRLEPWIAALDSDVVVVSHGGVARVLMTILADDPRSAAAEEPIVQGRALVFVSNGWRHFE